MPQTQVSLPVLFQNIHTDLARLGYIWVENFGEEVACKAIAFVSRQDCEDCTQLRAKFQVLKAGFKSSICEDIDKQLCRVSKLAAPKERKAGSDCSVCQVTQAALNVYTSSAQHMSFLGCVA